MPSTPTTVPTNAKRDHADAEAKQDPHAVLPAQLLLCTGAVWGISALQTTIFVFTRERMESDIGMGTVALEMLAAATPIGFIIGGPLFGVVADLRGRRTALLVSVTLALLGLALSAGARVDYEVLAIRVVTGIGLGGEVPAAVTLVYELAPNGRRGSSVALLHAFAAVGGALGVLLAYFVAPVLGWRVLYLVMSMLLLLLVAVVRVGVPQSPLWLQSVSHADEALIEILISDRVSINSHSANARTLESPSSCSSAAASPPAYRELEMSPPASLIDASAPIRLIAVLYLLWASFNVCGVALDLYLPSLISLTGFNIYKTWHTCTLLYIAPLAGSVAASMALNRGRDHREFLPIMSIGNQKLTLAVFIVAAVIFAVALSYLPRTGPVVMIGTSLVSISLSGAWSVVLAFTPEYFSVSKRARGVGVAVAFGGGGGVLGALALFPQVYEAWTLSVHSFAWTFGGVLASVTAALILLPSTRRA